MKSLAQGHTAFQWQRQGWDPDAPDSASNTFVLCTLLIVVPHCDRPGALGSDSLCVLRSVNLSAASVSTCKLGRKTPSSEGSSKNGPLGMCDTEAFRPSSAG